MFDRWIWRYSDKFKCRSSKSCCDNGPYQMKLWLPTTGVFYKIHSDPRDSLFMLQMSVGPILGKGIPEILLISVISIPVYSVQVPARVALIPHIPIFCGENPQVCWLVLHLSPPFHGSSILKHVVELAHVSGDTSMFQDDAMRWWQHHLSIINQIILYLNYIPSDCCLNTHDIPIYHYMILCNVNYTLEYNV